MKRSEILKELENFLNYELRIVSIHAEPILKFLEDKGIKPPEGFYSPQGGWEPEDEI